MAENKTPEQLKAEAEAIANLDKVLKSYTDTVNKSLTLEQRRNDILGKKKQNLEQVITALENEIDISIKAIDYLQIESDQRDILLEKRINALEVQQRRDAINREVYQKEIDLLKELKKVDDESTASYVKNLEKKIRSLDRNSESVAENIKAQQELAAGIEGVTGALLGFIGISNRSNGAISQLTRGMKGLLKNASKAGGGVKGFLSALKGGLGGILSFSNILINVVATLAEVAFNLDRVSRQLIGVSRNIEEANKLANNLIEANRATGISFSTLSTATRTAADSFKGFGLVASNVQSRIAALGAQTELLGGSVQGTSVILDSLFREGRIREIDNIEMAFKSLSVRLQELGVFPSQLQKDFLSLIPTMAMFGTHATANIARVSLMAQKAGVEAGVITQFAENFAGYSDAAKAAQLINATFGMPVIQDPQALVRTFYQGGPDAVVEEISRALQRSGATLGEGGERAAKIRLLSQLAGNPQDAVRMFEGMMGGSVQLTDAERSIIGLQPSEVAAGRFDEMAGRAIPIEEQVRNLVETAALQTLDGMFGGTDGPLGALSRGGDELIRQLRDAMGGPASELSTSMGGLNTSVGELNQTIKTAAGIKDTVKSVAAPVVAGMAGGGMTGAALTAGADLIGMETGDAARLQTERVALSGLKLAKDSGKLADTAMKLGAVATSSTGIKAKAAEIGFSATMKTGAFMSGKQVAKAIPLVGSGLSFASAGGNYMDAFDELLAGNVGRAIGYAGLAKANLVSGVAKFIPGLGTAAGLGIDAATLGGQLALDMTSETSQVNEAANASFASTVPQAQGAAQPSSQDVNVSLDGAELKLVLDDGKSFNAHIQQESINGINNKFDLRKTGHRLGPML